MIGLLLGFGKTPGWFALAGLPIVYIGAFAALTQFVIPEMEDRGLQLITDFAKEYAEIDLSLNNRSCIAALFVAVLMQLGTFYVFLLFSCLTGGIDNENPRVERQMLFLSPQGSFLGRLYAAHQNQSENVTCFAVAVFAAIVTTPSGFLSKSTATSDVAAIAWTHVLARSMYWLMYALNFPNLRTFAYVASVECVVMLFLRALKN